ncbi:hypothetical protein SFRURICE_015649 [Spodoptera frugiperda]|nr:hypothetical protein SFRURICE_015649 [Spodoptera frugiperda]
MLTITGYKGRIGGEDKVKPGVFTSSVVMDFPLLTLQAACQLRETCPESSGTWTTEGPTRP